MYLDVLDVMQEFVLHANQATKSGWVNGCASSKGNEKTLRKYWVITMLTHEFHHIRQLFGISFNFLSILYCNLDSKAVGKAGVVRFGINLAYAFVNTDMGVSSRMIS
jgi:hypothetical protein